MLPISLVFLLVFNLSTPKLLELPCSEKLFKVLHREIQLTLPIILLAISIYSNHI